MMSPPQVTIDGREVVYSQSFILDTNETATIHLTVRDEPVDFSIQFLSLCSVRGELQIQWHLREQTQILQSNSEVGMSRA